MTLCPTCPHKDRSPEEHRTLFGAIAKAYDNWPERHAFQPTSADHLRAWLTCAAGHHGTFEWRGDTRQLRAVVKEMTSKHTFFKDLGDGVTRVIWPLSLAKNKLPKKEFQELKTTIDELLKHFTGAGIEEYVAEAKRSAA